MALWTVDFLIEPTGREVTMQIHAETSRVAMANALNRLEMQPDELLHTLFAHIGRPIEESET